MTDQLRGLRDRIDALDDQILRLVNERAEVARHIGELKGDGPVYRPERDFFNDCRRARASSSTLRLR